MKKIVGTLMTDASIKKATGKTWPQWFRLLDKLPKDATHTERARWLYEKHLRKGWWCQKIVVVYEQTRGFRQPHEVVGGFQISASKTVPLSLKQAFQWWNNPTKRKKWLTANLTITKATPGKYVHIKWSDGSRVDVGFYVTSTKKTSVQLQHSKLKNATAAKKMKAWWKKQLDQFAETVDAA